MKNKSRSLSPLVAAVALFLASAGCPAGFAQALRTDEIVYPPGATAIIDVTKPPYNADNTGKTDCTTSLNRAYDDIMRVIQQAYQKTVSDLAAMSDAEYNSRYRENQRDRVLFPEDMTPSRILYFPNGTYTISNTLVYSLDLKNGQGNELSRQIHFQGQSQSGTLIRLVDHAPGFGEGAYKPVVSFMSGEKSNVAMSNTFENLTVEVGAGNPGAVGLFFHASNTGAVRHVTIRSRDPQRAGAVGLALLKGPQALFKNIRIEGFDYGICANHRLISGGKIAEPLSGEPAFEHITLSGQKKAGFLTGDIPVSIRKLTSRNTVPALQIAGRSGLVVLLDSDLSGGEVTQPALDFGAGFLFARNVSTAGYGTVVRRTAIGREGASPVLGTRVEEYSSHGVQTLFDSPQKSLNLPVEETLDVPWESDPDKWVSVNQFGAKGDGRTDDTRAIQAALNSGKPVVYFNPGSYLLNGSVTVPAGVRRLNFMYADLVAGDTLKSREQGAFVINGQTTEPLVVEDLLAWEKFRGDHYFIDHASTRPLVISDVHLQAGAMYKNSVRGGTVFIENVCSVDGDNQRRGNCFTFTGQRVWARQLDSERASPEVLNDGSTLWVLGSKTEAAGVSYETRNGGKTEVLGGNVINYSPVIADGQPMLINHESQVSHIIATNGRSEEGHYFRVLVWETRQGVTKELRWEDVPRRIEKQSVLPLYVGDGNAVKP